MKTDDIFSTNNPDAYLSSVMSVGKVAAYICSICGSFVSRDYLVLHTDFHNKIETMENDICTLNNHFDTWDGD
jgi:hypothetical protein